MKPARQPAVPASRRESASYYDIPPDGDLVLARQAPTERPGDPAFWPMSAAATAERL